MSTDYPSERADSLEEFVRKRFDLSSKETHIYGAMRWLERDHSGFCRPFIAPYRELSRAAQIHPKFIKPALLELMKRGLCMVVFGSPIKLDKQATTIQRKTLDEIKTMTTLGEDACHRLAQALNERGFPFNGKPINPTWSVSKTGRVNSSKPNVQGMQSDKRVSGLRADLKAGQVLVDSDIRQAEPSLIKFLLGIPPTQDLYQEYMAATGADKATAKKKINMLAYCRNSAACFRHWPESAQTALGDYVETLDAYKTRLLADARAKRRITTLAGRWIAAGSGEHVHAGMLFNWRVQGTIADVVNAASLRLMETASAIIPMHDGILAVVPSDKASTVATTIEEEARKIGLSLVVKEKVHHGK